MRRSNENTIILSSARIYEYVRSDNNRVLTRIVKCEKIRTKEQFGMDGFRTIATGKPYTEYEIMVKEDGYWCEYGITRKLDKAYRIAERVGTRVIRYS